MSELTRDDIRQAVRNELTNALNDIRSIKESTTRTEHHTTDISQLSGLASEVQRLNEFCQSWSGVKPHDIQDIKLRVQNIEKGIAQIVHYLQASEHERDQDSGYKGF